MTVFDDLLTILKINAEKRIFTVESVIKNNSEVFWGVQCPFGSKKQLPLEH